MADASAAKGATDLAAELSTDDSPSFVNGLLGQVQRLAPSLRGVPAADEAAESVTVPEAAPAGESEQSPAQGSAQEPESAQE